MSGMRIMLPRRAGAAVPLTRQHVRLQCMRSTMQPPSMRTPWQQVRESRLPPVAQPWLSDRWLRAAQSLVLEYLRRAVCTRRLILQLACAMPRHFPRPYGLAPDWLTCCGSLMYRCPKLCGQIMGQGHQYSLHQDLCLHKPPGGTGRRA